MAGFFMCAAKHWPHATHNSFSLSDKGSNLFRKE